MPQSLTCLNYHVVFSTKDRRDLIVDEFQKDLYKYIGGIFKGMKSKLIAVGGMPDHIHLLGSLHKELSISDALRTIKTNSSKWVHTEYPERRNFAWQAGYAAFSVSFSRMDSVDEYIANQVSHHRRKNFKSELRTLLKKHEIEFDERYLWE
jgi:REP-associated tyrosine transposase